MSANPFEQSRIQQLTSSYGPDEPPRLTLDFGDYLSLMWRADHHYDHPGKRRYYRQCVQALGEGMGIRNRSLFRLVDMTEPGELYRQLANAPYRGTHRLIDAQDRKAAITELVKLRGEIMHMGTLQEGWGGSFPGSGLVDAELRERVFAVLFTAMQGQFAHFGRLLLVVDIVLANLLLGFEPTQECSLHQLVAKYGYPNPNDARVRYEYYAEPTERG